MAPVRPLIAGNWKMNGLTSALAELRAMVQGGAASRAKADLMICPPATLIHAAVAAASDQIAIGAQDCHPAASGAHTGDLSAEMIADVGASAVIVGHSERRTDHAETDAVVAAKAKAAWRAGLTALICVGETQAERDGEQALAVVTRQLDGSVPDAATAGNTVIAYEPVWAIGTGRTPTAADVAEMHAAIRDNLVKRFGEAAQQVRLLYGGSVKPSNAAELMAVPHVNGALVGGASLKAADFLAIAAACP